MPVLQGGLGLPNYVFKDKASLSPLWLLEESLPPIISFCNLLVFLSHSESPQLSTQCFLKY